MNTPTNPVVRVEVEHADGTLRRLDGPEADLWMRAHARAMVALNGFPVGGPRMVPALREVVVLDGGGGGDV